MLFQEQIKTVKQAAPELAATTNEQRNAALAAVRTALQQHQEEIFEANRQDGAGGGRWCLRSGPETVKI